MEQETRFRVALVLDERGDLITTGVTAGNHRAGARFLAALEPELQILVKAARKVSAYRDKPSWVRPEDEQEGA